MRRLFVFLYMACGLGCGVSELQLPEEPPAPTPEFVDDECPDDPAKIAPGRCGCGNPDIDSDGDGRFDCDDLCPEDRLKFEPGECGCGVVEDATGDLIADCESGCADGEREGFNRAYFLDIAGCSGGWEVRGVQSEASFELACDRQAGDDGDNPKGLGCSVADLCAEGWHVCRSQLDVAGSLPEIADCREALEPGAPPAIFLSRQSGSGFNRCDGAGFNDLFGCGTLGFESGDRATCAPLLRHVTDLCLGLIRPWRCGNSQDGEREALVVYKAGPAAGGVMCCRD